MTLTAREWSLYMSITREAMRLALVRHALANGKGWVMTKEGEAR